MYDVEWYGLAELPVTTVLDNNRRSSVVQPWDVIFLCRSPAAGGGDPLRRTAAAAAADELTSCVLQAVPTGLNDHYENDKKMKILVHPILFDFLSQASALTRTISTEGENDVDAHDTADESGISQEANDAYFRASIGPLPLPASLSLEQAQLKDDHTEWNVTKVVDRRDLPTGAVVVLKCLYVEEEPSISNIEKKHVTTRGLFDWNLVFAQALEGRWVMKQSTILLSTFDNRCALVTVEGLLDVGNTSLDERGVAYRLGTCDLFTVKSSLASSCETITNSFDNTPRPSQLHEHDCPGYDHVAKELAKLLCIQGTAAPSGIFLTGCTGVGKSRLASCVAFSMAEKGWKVHWVSLQDLVLRSSWATEEDMFDQLIPNNSTHGGALVVILDNLDVLATEDSDSTSLDNERRLVWNSMLQVIDRNNNNTPTPTRFLGIGRDASRIPAELFKIGRLEKPVSIAPPTQSQRELILVNILQQSKCDPKRCQQWAELLATMTAGCVAADLRRLCVDACTRAIARNCKDDATPSWDELFEAAMACIPSQLAALDVTKPEVFVDKCLPDDWLRVHELSWRLFAGKDLIKKRIYRTVVMPWRSHLSSRVRHKTVMPPSGVLFHGPSGCGTTFAANCLGSSLGLPMIKVRASDVLDKWLGGSEAALRSLFARARAAAPSILFFDEIDAIASNRASDGETTGVMSRILSTLLNEMDGVTSGQNDNVLIVACTNRLETLDAALVRPGRLEEHIELTQPTEEDARLMLCLHLARAKLDDNVDLGDIAAKLVAGGTSAAAVEGVAREAVLRAIRRSKDYSDVSVQSKDFTQAMSAIML